MKRLVLTGMIMCGLFVLSGCGQFKVVQGDGDVITETLTLESFDQLRLKGHGVVVNYSCNDQTPSVSITTDKNIYEMYKLVAKNGELVVEPVKEYFNAQFRPTTFVLEVNSAALKEVKVSGGVEFNQENAIRSEELKFNVSGSGKLNLNELLEVQNMEVSISGSGTVNASQLTGNRFRGNISGSGTFHMGGEMEHTEYHISGSGKAHSYDMNAKSVAVHISGAGNLEVTALESLEVHVSGSGKVFYKGEPKIEQHISGSGSVKRAD